MKLFSQGNVITPRRDYLPMSCSVNIFCRVCFRIMKPRIDSKYLRSDKVTITLSVVPLTVSVIMM
jgi:hypothetical protein